MIPVPRTLQRVALWCLASIVAFLISRPSAAAESVDVWELTPYRVRVLVALSAEPEFTSGFRRDLQSSLVDRLEASVGAAWQLEVSEAAAALRPIILRTAAGSTFSEKLEPLPSKLIDSKDDKVVLLALAGEPLGWRVTARELDLRTRLWGANVSTNVGQRGCLADEAARVVLGAFAPLARIDEVSGKTARLRLRASALFPPESPLATHAAGALFRPVIRFNDQEGKPRRIEPIEWTILRVESTSPEATICQIYSGLRSPLSGRRRGRIEPLALAVQAREEPTRLEFVSRTARERRLTGYEVRAFAPPEKATLSLGLTDEQGILVVPPSADPLRLLLVQHGEQLLARLPLVGGMNSSLTVEIPDDDQRLEAEGFITGLQESLVDFVARREVLVMRIRSKLQAGDVDEARRLFKEMRQFGSAEQFSLPLKRQRQLLASGDPQVQAKIARLFDDTQEVVNRFLDPRVIERLERELAEAKNSNKSGK
jgi:pentatricopeptide repeat protein